jgi:TatD DNase family protein
MMIDSHCHLADDGVFADAGAVVARAREAGVAKALCILDATSPEELARREALAGLWTGVRFAVGVHPHQASRFAADPSGAADAVRPHLPGAIALGEIGLDYHYDFAPRAVQQAVLRAQLALALEHDLPVVIHCREAERDLLAILREARGSRGVFHCFTGDATLASEVLALGFHVSFSGIVTFPKAAEVRAAARMVPGDRLLVETDTPYLAPVPHRGKRSEPAFVVHVARALAEVRGVAFDTIVSETGRAFHALFERARENASGPGNTG